MQCLSRLLRTCKFRFCPLIYFCSDNVYVRVESVVPKLSSRHHKYARRNATMQVRNLTETNGRHATDCHAVSVNDRRRLKRIIVFLKFALFSCKSNSFLVAFRSARLSRPIIFIPWLRKQFVARRVVFEFHAKISALPFLLDNVETRENAHLRMQREFMSLSREEADGFAGAKVHPRR